jgi:putative endonuclease
MKFVTYYLESISSGRRYIGASEDLERRVKEHNSGKNKATAPFRPWKILGFVEHDSLSEARLLENKFKKMKSRARVQAYIESEGLWC